MKSGSEGFLEAGLTFTFVGDICTNSQQFSIQIVNRIAVLTSRKDFWDTNKEIVVFTSGGSGWLTLT